LYCLSAPTLPIASSAVESPLVLHLLFINVWDILAYKSCILWFQISQKCLP
jgi:hypothetical protein